MAQITIDTIDEKLAELKLSKDVPDYSTLFSGFSWTREWFAKVEEVLLVLAFRGESDKPILDFIRAKIRETDIITFNRILSSLGETQIVNHYEIIIREIGADYLLKNENMDIVTALFKYHIEVNYVGKSVLSLCPNDTAVDHLISNPYKIEWINFRSNKNIKAINYYNANVADSTLTPSAEDEKTIDYLIANPHRINHEGFASNPHPKAVDYMFNNPEIMFCSELSKNPNDRVVDYLIANPQQIHRRYMSHNTNPRAVDYLLANPRQIYECVFYSRNDSRIVKHIIENIDKINQITTVNTNPNDDIVDFLLANPQYIYINYFSQNSNDKVLEYLLKQPGLRELLYELRYNTCNYNMQKLRAFNAAKMFPRLPHLQL